MSGYRVRYRTRRADWKWVSDFENHTLGHVEFTGAGSPRHALVLSYLEAVEVILLLRKLGVNARVEGD